MPVPPFSELNVPVSPQRLIAMQADLENGTRALCARAIFEVRPLATAPLSRKRYIELARRRQKAVQCENFPCYPLLARPDDGKKFL